MEDPAAEGKQLEQAIAALESQRADLGDEVVDAAQATLREKLNSLGQTQREQEAAPQSERRILTVLFCDVTGSTAMAEQMDPEEWTGIMNAAFSHLIEPVYRYGGTVSRLLGDAVLAFFGAPVAHEDDPVRACRAALEMIEGAHEYAGRLAKEGGVSGFNVRVGINTGLVVVGQVGSELRDEYTAMGDAVNVAARLESAAEPGTVLIGEDTYRLVSNVVQTEPLGPLRMKGKAEPMPVYRLIGMTTRPESAQVQSIQSPLIGREEEIATLTNCLDDLMDGQGGLVSVIGEAGLGKSRLMAEVHQSLMTTNKIPITWLEGRALSYGQTISYWPFHEILWQYTGITEEDGEAEAWDKLEAHVEALFGQQTAEILPYLASMLALDIDEEYAERVKYLEGDAMRQQIFLVSRRFFERLAREAPLVLIFEDLHWADESSALLLEHLLPLIERAPILFCGVSRPEADTPAAHLQKAAAEKYDSRYTELILRPLSVDDSRQMLFNLAQIEQLSSRVQQMIVGKADGNPFFLEEIVRALADDGSIVRDQTTGKWRATGRIDSITIPDTVQGVIVARLDQLSDDLKWVLRTASVIGRSFLFRLLGAVVQDDRHQEEPDQLDRQLNTLQLMEFIREKQRLPELEYIFKHALAQETTYESMLIERRRTLHGRVGQAIERLFSERLEEFYGLLAYHYARAESWDKAQDYLLKAGDQAIALAADTEALSYYRQALQTYSRAGEESWGPLQRATLERKMGFALVWRGDFERALEALQRALGYLDLSLPASLWRIRLSIVREAAQQLAHRLLPRLFLARTYEPMSDELEEEFRVYEGISYVELVANPERFLLLTLRILNRAERNGAAWGVASGSFALALAMTIVPLRKLPEGYFRRALALAEQEEMLDVKCQVQWGLAWYEAFQGHWAEALSLSQRAAKIAQVTGQPFSWAFPRYQIATILTYHGHYVQALTYCQELIEFGRDGAASRVLCWGLAALGFVRRHQGRLDEAIGASREAAELARAVPDRAFVISAEADRGRSHLGRGRLDEALTSFETSLRSYEDFMGPDSYVSLRNGLAEAHLLAAERNYQGDGPGWLKQARKSCRHALKLGKQFRPGLPEAQRLRGTLEWLRGKPSSAQKWWQKSLALAGELGQPYDLGQTHLEMGRRFIEPGHNENAGQEHLEQAEIIFVEIGAELDLSRTREILDGLR